MYHVKTLIVVLAILILITHPDSYGIVYGSNTATTVQAFVTFPQTDTTNTMLGFGSFPNGFGLASANTTCTFNDFYPVSSTMVLNGGTLILLEDLHLDSQLIVSSAGTIVGNRRCVSFAPQTYPIFFPYGNQLNQLSTQNAGSIAEWVDWTSDNNYMAVGTYAHPGPEIQVYSFNGSALTLAASFHYNITFFDVAWRPGAPSPAYYLVAATSTDLRAYSFTPPNSLVLATTVGTGTTFWAASWHPSGNAIAVSRNAVTTQQIMIYDFNVATTSLTYHTSYSFPAAMTVQGRALDFDYTGSYLAAGFQGGNQLQVLSWNGATLVSTASAATASGAVLATKWSPDGSLIAVGAGATVQLFSFNRNTQSLTLLPSYNYVTTGNIQGLAWSNDGNTLAVSVKIGTTTGLLVFLTLDKVFTQSSLCFGQYDIGGAVYSAKWSPNGIYFATGDYAPAFTGYATVYNFLSGTMAFSNTNIVFYSPVQLRTPMSFSGTCIINGNGNTLNLNSQVLTVTANSSLLFKDITLEGITGTNLQCLDNTGTISFDNVTCMIDNSMQLNQGKFAITGECVMTGTGTFIYSSNQASTISSHAQWYFDRGVTFSYYPQGGGTGLINFADSSAQLYLYATNLYAASTGLHLTKGSLMIDGPCQFLSDSMSEATGIWIGDGIAADDLKVKILAESGIIVGKGYVSYRNTK